MAEAIKDAEFEVENRFKDLEKAQGMITFDRYMFIYMYMYIYLCVYWILSYRFL